MSAPKRSKGATGLDSWTTLWLVLITLGAASLRFYHLGLNSFAPDEAFSITFVRTGWSAFRHVLVTSEANMGLYFLLLRGWSQISDTPSFVRALSVVAGVATVPAIYFLGNILFSPRVGIISALLLAVNVFHIFYSQEARGYSLVVLLVTCSSLFFARDIKNQRGLDRFWYIFTSAASLYAHLFAALVLLAHFASWTLLPGRLRSRSQLHSLLAITVFGLPLAVFIAFKGTSQLDWIQRQPHRAKEVYHFFMYLTGSGIKFGMFLLATVVASRGFWLQRRHKHEGLEAWPFAFIALWLLIPILITIIASYWKPVFVFRYLMICLPAALLLFGHGLALIRPSWLCFAIVLVTLCSSLLGVRSFYRKPGPSDWRAAISYLAQNARSGDMLIFANPYCRFPFDYNLRVSGQRLPPIMVEYTDPGAIRDFPAHTQHVWVADFFAQAHHHWTTLPAETVDSKGLPRFRFQRTLRFPGVEIEEFDSSNEVH